MASKTKLSDADYMMEYEGGLSDSTLRAKWVDDASDHAERDGQTLATRNHEVIRAWAEERKAVPATVESSWHGNRPGVLRFDFPGFSEGRLQKIEWDQWFDTFDSRDLVMLFQEKMSDGKQSNFFRFDSPHREES